MKDNPMNAPLDMKKFVQILFFAIALMCAPALLSTSALGQSGGPVNISGDQFDIDEGNNKATFTGNVVIKQSTFQLWAPRVTASYGEGGPSDLKKITADGRIRVKFGTQTAISDHGIYDPKTKILRMIGNVSVTQANNTNAVNGPEMIIDLANDTTRFVGTGTDDGRVTAVFGSDN